MSIVVVKQVRAVQAAAIKMKEWVTEQIQQRADNPPADDDESWVFSEYIASKAKDFETGKKFDRTDDEQGFVFPEDMPEVYRDLLRKSWWLIDTMASTNKKTAAPSMSAYEAGHLKVMREILLESRRTNDILTVAVSGPLNAVSFADRVRSTTLYLPLINPRLALKREFSNTSTTTKVFGCLAGSVWVSSR